MSHEIVHHVTLTLRSGYAFDVSFDDVPGAPTFVVDEPRPLGESEGPNAAALLAAAVANCLAASLIHCLRKTRAEVESLTARVAAHVVKNDVGRYRVTRLDVELDPRLRPEDAGRLARCEGLFEDFCIVTESVRQGIPVAVSVKTLEVASV
jgi:uncharacterized OsmC-like protein